MDFLNPYPTPCRISNQKAPCESIFHGTFVSQLYKKKPLHQRYIKPKKTEAVSAKPAYASLISFIYTVISKLFLIESVRTVAYYG